MPVINIEASTWSELDRLARTREWEARGGWRHTKTTLEIHVSGGSFRFEPYDKPCDACGGKGVVKNHDR